MAGCMPNVPVPGVFAPTLYVRPVEPAALQGTWYEVAHFPTRATRGCSHTTATYTLRQDGALDVVNRCRRNGEVVQISGVATPLRPGVLKVRLEGVPIQSNLLVLGTSSDGRTLYLGTPARVGGWVLHRDRRFSDQQRRAAAELFAVNGYDEAALQRTDQR